MGAEIKDLGSDRRSRWEEKKGYAAALENLMSERQKVFDYGEGLSDEREQLQILIENV